MTKSQQDELVRILETDAPPRADVELLQPDGNLSVVVYDYFYGPERGVQRACAAKLIGRRGQLLREAKRHGDKWDEFAHRYDEKLPPSRASDAAIITWVRGGHSAVRAA